MALQDNFLPLYIVEQRWNFTGHNILQWQHPWLIYIFQSCKSVSYPLVCFWSTFNDANKYGPQYVNSLDT
jgi:hypothetical protein